jgi:CubicO group peptidase (beta-lactamase class C family)
MKRPAFRTAILLLGISALLSTQTNCGSQIGAVEKGLLPAVLIQGDPAWTIQERMQYHKVPAVSIAVIRDFKIDWAKAYGLADVEAQQPVTTETLFQAGSISKPVAAMVALKKVEEGKIALDEDINNKLTSWKVSENELTKNKKVTLANLLSHTAGLTVPSFPGYQTGALLPSIIQVLDGLPPANTEPVRVDIEPGTQARYSGGGTIVMQLALMDIEQKSFPQIARDTVLGPLEMKNSAFEQPLPPTLLKTAAAGHRLDGKPIRSKRYVYPEMAAAGLWTTPSDLARFAIEVQLSLAGKSNKIISKDMSARMVSPFVDPTVGLGFFLERKENAIYFWHPGADEGFRAVLKGHLEKGYGAVVMVNSNNERISEEILRAVARAYGWENYLPEPQKIVAVQPRVLDAYAGRYLIDPDDVLTVIREDGKLFAHLTALPKGELRPISETRFIHRDESAHPTFQRNGSESASAVSIEAAEIKTSAPRIPDSKRAPYERLLAGEFAASVDAYREIKKDTPDNVAVRATAQQAWVRAVERKEDSRSHLYLQAQR